MVTNVTFCRSCVFIDVFQGICVSSHRRIRRGGVVVSCLRRTYIFDRSLRRRRPTGDDGSFRRMRRGIVVDNWNSRDRGWDLRRDCFGAGARFRVFENPLVGGSF